MLIHKSAEFKREFYFHSPDTKHSTLLVPVDQCQDLMSHSLLLSHPMSLVSKLAMMLAGLPAAVAQLQHENLNQ